MLFLFLIESEMIVFSVAIIKIAGTLGCDLRMPIMSVQIGYRKIMIKDYIIQKSYSSKC